MPSAGLFGVSKRRTAACLCVCRFVPSYLYGISCEWTTIFTSLSCPPRLLLSQQHRGRNHFGERASGRRTWRCSVQRRFQLVQRRLPYRGQHCPLQAQGHIQGQRRCLGESNVGTPESLLLASSETAAIWWRYERFVSYHRGSSPEQSMCTSIKIVHSKVCQAFAIE